MPASQLSFGGIGRAIGGIVKDLIPGTIGDGLIDRVTGGGGPAAAAPCPRGRVRVGPNCVAIQTGATSGAVIPYTPRPPIAIPSIPSRGAPIMIPGASFPAPVTGGAAVVGAFGIPAMQPQVEFVERRQCLKGMVLGEDNLCYAKGSLPRKFRKWRPDPRPPVTAADAKAIRRADRTRKRLVALTNKSGAFAAASRPRTRRKE